MRQNQLLFRLGLETQLENSTDLAVINGGEFYRFRAHVFVFVTSTDFQG
jgi:hypothetical protein